MGLDLYLYRCQKPKLKDGSFLDKKTFKEYTEDYNFFNYDDSDFLDCPTMVKNAVRVKVEQEIYDLKRIAEAICVYNCKDFDPVQYAHKDSNVYFTSFSDKNIVFEYYNAETKDLLKKEFSNKEIKDYIIVENADGFLIKLNEVAYQRKGLNDLGWELMPCDNTCFSDNYDCIEQMVVEGGLSDSFLENWEEGFTVFHPWW